MRITPKQEEPDDADLQAPHELVSELKRLPRERVFVPPAVDAAVARAAREHLGGVKAERTAVHRGLLQWLRRQPRAARSESAPYHWWKILVAASAAVLVLALLVYQFSPPGRGRTFGLWNPFASSGPANETVPVPLPGNATTQRHMDILDAFTLARQLKAGPVHEPRWDVNHDGIVDERDVRAIAVEVVRLDKGGRS